MSPTSDTSRAAYREHIVTGRALTQRRRIMDCLRFWSTPLTRRQIGDLTGLRINAVCGRVDELIRSGLVRVSGQGKDAGSLAPASQFIELTPEAASQHELPWRDDRQPRRIGIDGHIEFNARDLWLGVYWRPSWAILDGGRQARALHLYLTLIPMLPLHVRIYWIGDKR